MQPHELIGMGLSVGFGPQTAPSIPKPAAVWKVGCRPWSGWNGHCIWRGPTRAVATLHTVGAPASLCHMALGLGQAVRMTPAPVGLGPTLQVVLTGDACSTDPGLAGTGATCNAVQELPGQTTRAGQLLLWLNWNPRCLRHGSQTSWINGQIKCAEEGGRGGVHGPDSSHGQATGMRYAHVGLIRPRDSTGGRMAGV